MIEWVKDNIKISANQSVSAKVSHCLMDLNADENKKRFCFKNQKQMPMLAKIPVQDTLGILNLM